MIFSSIGDARAPLSKSSTLWKLGVAGNIQMVLYSTTVVVLGFVMFAEKISPVQGVGIGLALLGVILMGL